MSIFFIIFYNIFIFYPNLILLLRCYNLWKYAYTILADQSKGLILVLKHPLEQQFSSTLHQCNECIQKDHLNNLERATLCTTKKFQNQILLFKINHFTTSTTSQYFTYVFNALASLNTTIGIILERHKSTLNFYLGLSIDPPNTTSCEIFAQGFASTFLNSKITAYNAEESKTLLNNLFCLEHISSITSTIVIPDNTNADADSTLQKFSSLFPSENYVALFLASPTDCNENKNNLNTFLDLFDSLSQFQQSNFSCGNIVAHNKSCTLTATQSSSSSNSCTNTNSSSTGSSAANYTNISPSTTVPLGNSTRVVNMSATFNEAIGSNQGTSQSQAKGNTEGCSNGKSEANMNATNLSDSSSISFCRQNKLITTDLSIVSNFITRLTDNTNNAMFCFNAFFFAPLASTTIRAGYTYAGLAKDTSFYLEPTFVSTWPSTHCNFRSLLKELRHFQIPKFKLPRGSKSFKACTTITSSELLNTFYFPTKTVPAKSTHSTNSKTSASSTP